MCKLKIYPKKIKITNVKIEIIDIINIVKILKGGNFFMKKIISIVTIYIVLLMSIFSIKTYAASLDSINITTDKETVNPNDTIKVNIQFGEDLGAYTVDVAYDNNLLEYVSAEGGTENDNGTRVRVYFYDQTGGSSPRNNMSVTFKAKDGITTSNPTDLSITAEGLANADASVTYDDITTPIIKNIVVEPVYTDYDIALNYTGDVIKDEKKDMKIVVSSSMGKNYEHTRIIAKATTPSGATVNLFATDSQGLEHDIIQNGWGDADGDSIGGVNVRKELDVRGLFSIAGDYSITLSLIDRDNSDAEIVSKTFTIAVLEEAKPTEPENPEEVKPEEKPEPVEPEENPEANGETNNKEQNKVITENKNNPKNLPKTGNTIYVVILSIVAVLVVSYICIRKRK